MQSNVEVFSLEEIHLDGYTEASGEELEVDDVVSSDNKCSGDSSTSLTVSSNACVSDNHARGCPQEGWEGGCLYLFN